MVVVLQYPHYAVVRDVAEDDITAGAKIGRALGPAEAGCDSFHRSCADTAFEPLVQRFDVSVGIARVGQRAERAAFGGPQWHSGLAQWTFGSGIGRRYCSRSCSGCGTGQKSTSVHVSLPLL